MSDLMQILAGAGGGTLLTGAISLWVRDKARAAADERFRELIRAELAVFKVDLMGTLNGTYIRSSGATLTGAEIERRLESLEDQE